MVHLMARSVAAIAISLLAVLPVFGQQYPSKPIRMIVGFPPGGIMDIYARMLAKPMQERLKVPVVIENRPGAGGIVGAIATVNADPDGYTIHHIAPSAISRVFVKDLPHDFYTALQPIGPIWESPYILAINNQVPATTLKEFVEYARANPGKLNLGGSSGVNFLPIALLSNPPLQVQHIEFKGNAQMHTSLLVNEVQLVFSTTQALLPYLQSGKMRMLGVTGARRVAAIPDVPTTTEAGFPSLQASVIGAMMGPVGMPEPVVAKLVAALKEAIATPEMDKLLNANGRPLVGGPQELTKLLRDELAVWSNAAKISGYQPK
jgi:tripartite-type tricarboxylate transporter receptor subunit TctC